jgi:hypothetical protein
MKKILLVFILFCAMASHANAQEQGDIRVHALGFYGLRFNEFGVGGGVEYFFADRFAMMPSYLRLCRKWAMPAILALISDTT